jgi:hypothetical protein
MVKILLELFGVPYIPIEALSMQERVRTVERVLELAGMAPPEPGAEARPAADEPRPRVRQGNGTEAAGARN